MAVQSSVQVLDVLDQRLIAALQCDGRLTAERAAAVLGLSARTVRRRWRALMADGTVRVVTVPERPAGVGALLLRVKVLRGKLDTIAAALAARDDIPFLDLSASGDELTAVAWAEPGTRSPLVFRSLPATQAVTSVTASTVLHVFRQAHEWRHTVLTDDERKRLNSASGKESSLSSGGFAAPADEVDRLLLAELSADARVPAASVAVRVGLPESTVRRRIARLTAEGVLRTQVVVDPRLLGLGIDANVEMRVAPGRLDAVGRALAAHPAVHGAFATTGAANLQVAVWTKDLAELYEFVTDALGRLQIESAETLIVGQAVKRPGRRHLLG